MIRFTPDESAKLKTGLELTARAKVRRRLRGPIIRRFAIFVERHSFGLLVGLNYRRATEFGPLNVFHPIRFAAWTSDACHE
jgi:hypothetical protein